MRRALFRPAVALAFLCASLAPAQPAASQAVGPIQWSVDHANQEVKVTAAILLWFMRPPSPESAARVENAIESAWNGQHFKCYDFKVDAAVSVHPDGSRPGSSAAAIPIMFPDYTSEVRSNVEWTTSGPDLTYVLPSDPLSDDPLTDYSPTGGTWWAHEPDWVYAHEFGHLLGLEDGYVDVTDPTLRAVIAPGVPADAMSTYGGAVTPELITKVVRRSDQVDESEIRCPLAFRAGPASSHIGSESTAVYEVRNLEVSGRACDYEPPTSDPERTTAIPFTATATYEAYFRAVTGDNAGGPVSETTEFELTPGQPATIAFEGLTLTGTFVWDETTVIAPEGNFVVTGAVAETGLVELGPVTVERGESC